MNDSEAKMLQFRFKELTEKEIPVSVIKLVFEEYLTRRRKYEFDEMMGRNI